MRFNLTVVALLSVIPFVVSTSIGKNHGPNACKESEFWWKDKECCLPHGGPPKPPAPPKGSSCPPASHYWNNEKGCCVPRHPPPEHGPQPQCPKDCTWYPSLYKCLPNPHNTKPPTPTPSKTPSPGGNHHGGNHGGSSHGDNNHGGHNNGGYEHGGGGGHYRRNVLKSRVTLCPVGLEACPIPGSISGDYECLDTTVDLGSCGGCVTFGEGQDCTAIPGAWNVGCENSQCIVFTCSAGFKRSADGKACLPL